MNGPNKLATPSLLAAAFASLAVGGRPFPIDDTAMPFHFTEHSRSRRKSQLKPNVWHKKKVRRRMAKVSRLINGGAR